jgi:hypothetical protein
VEGKLTQRANHGRRQRRCRDRAIPTPSIWPALLCTKTTRPPFLAEVIYKRRSDPNY